VEPEHIWSQVRARLRRSLPEATYQIWLEPLTLREMAGSTMVVVAPTEIRQWVVDRFHAPLQRLATSVAGTPIELDILSPSMAASSPRRPGALPAAAGAAAAEISFNPKLTFEQFVIGDSNRLAHAAALAVAEMPAQAYNPLFIYGPPGLGKTHLLHSIANYISRYTASLSVRYTTVESFTNEFVAALQARAVDRFKHRFRHTDVLLVDDVQFLERKARTEEEFFHTFNALYDVGGQLVVTSDRLPADLRAVEERLRERFESGLVTNIGPPDHDTRMTILRKRAHHDAVPLSDEAPLGVIADRVVANVRALEGALIRIVAYASLIGQPVTAPLASHVLDELYPEHASHHSTVEAIQRTVCHTFDVTHHELVGPSRSARVAWPRHVAMYLSRELTDHSLPAIGRAFGDRDHTTVLKAWQRTCRRVTTDERASQTIGELTRHLAQ
jgi:chromosomal replication initiator protein